MTYLLDELALALGMLAFGGMIVLGVMLWDRIRRGWKV